MYSLATSLLGDTAPEASEAFGLMEAARLYDHKALPRLRYGGWVGCGALEGAGLALEHVLSSHGCLPPPWADLPLSLLGSHGSYILCAQQLQAHPSAEAHRVVYSGPAAGEEASIHHPVRGQGVQAAGRR